MLEPHFNALQLISCFVLGYVACQRRNAVRIRVTHQEIAKTKIIQAQTRDQQEEVRRQIAELNKLAAVLQKLQP